MKFKYASHEFELDDTPRCNICGNELIFKLRKKHKPNKYIYYQIIDCIKCDLKTRELKWKSFLPIYLYNEIKLKYKNLLIKNHIFKIDNYLKKGYTKDEAKNKISEIQKERSKKAKKVGVSNNHLKNVGYTEEEIKNMRVGPNQIKYWIRKGYTEDEAKIEVSNHQSIVSKGTIRSGTGKYPNQIEYWVGRGYTEDEAKKEISERQRTFTMKKCIEKYGEIEGRKRWVDRQEKWMNNYKKSNFSKISQELFWKLYEKIDNKNELYFATLKNDKKDDSGVNNEYRLKLIDGSLVMPDFFIKDRKKIIEFDGTYYHRKNNENIKREKIRDNKVRDSGFEIFHVNEYKYKKDPDKIINDCIQFLNK